MPAPLVAAATYFGLPRLLGGLADKVAQSRYEDLTSRGVNPQADTLLNVLSLVPRQSGLETTLQDLDYLRAMSNMPVAPVPDIEEQPAGYQVTRELPYDQGAVFNTPMEDFLKYGGTDDDSGNRFDTGASYGQTYQPASTVEFPTGPQMVPDADYDPYAPQDRTGETLVSRMYPYGPEGKEVEFNTPMDDFLKFGGRDDDNRDQLDDLSDLRVLETAAPVLNETPQQQQGGGFASGGLADILRMMYAQRQR